MSQFDVVVECKPDKTLVLKLLEALMDSPRLTYLKNLMRSCG